MIERSKLRAPRVPPRLVARPRLVQRIRDAREHRLVLVVAPAGFGKSTLLAELAHDDSNDVALAYVSLDADDDEPSRLWALLGLALASICDGIDEDLAHALLEPDAPPVDAAVHAWTEALLDATSPACLVLDDVHVLRSEAVHASLVRFVERLPPTLQLVVATRAEPPWPLARWRVADDVTELGADALRFVDEEAMAFLTARLGDRMAPSDMVSLTRAADGWAAGLQLAAASLRGSAAPGHVADAFDGRHRHVADYLASEILGRLAPDMRDFIQRASVLETLTATACAAVTADPEPARRLEALERDGLPLGALDSLRHAWRLHPLLRDHLRESMRTADPERFAETHRRAARYFEPLDPDVAFRHALASGDRSWAERLLATQAARAIERSRPLALLRDVRRLGCGLAELATPLLMAVAWAAFLTGRTTELRAALTTLQGRRAKGELGDETWAQVCNLRSGLARGRCELEEAVEHANEGLAIAPPGEALAAGLLLYRAVGEYGLLRFEAAAESCATCLECFPVDAPPAFVELTAASLLAQVRLEQGRLGEATRLESIARARCDVNAMSRAPMMATVARTDGRIALMRGDWQEAHARFEEARQLATAGGLTELGAVIESFRAELAWLTGARATMDEALGELSRVAGRDRWVRKNQEGLLARRDLDEGRANAVAPLDPMAVGHADLGPIELRRLALRREESAALDLTAQLLQRAHSAGATSMEVGLLAMKGWLHARRGHAADAETAIAEALERAAPEAIVRGFVDADLSEMAALVLRASARTRLPAASRTHAQRVHRCVQALLDARRAADGPPAILSARELELMRLLADGLSNKQIAATLHVSLSTVKTHVNRIFHKLGVRRRTQAVATARATGLI